MYSLFRRVHLLVRRHGHILQAGFEVVSMVWRLTKEEHSVALAELASRISAIWKFGAGTGEDPFAKVKGCDHGCVCSLQEEASTEACQETSKATVRCDSPRSSRVAGVLCPPSLWVESGSGSLATPRCAEARKCSGAAWCSAGVRSNVSSPRTKKKVTHAPHPAARARMCAVCPHDWWNKSRMWALTWLRSTRVLHSARVSMSRLRDILMFLHSHFFRAGGREAFWRAGVVLLFPHPPARWRRAKPARQTPVTLQRRGLCGFSAGVRSIVSSPRTKNERHTHHILQRERACAVCARCALTTGGTNGSYVEEIDEPTSVLDHVYW